MKPTNIRLAAAAIICILAAFSQTGCKETTIINAKVAPNIDHITVFDTTLPCLSKSIYDSNITTGTYYGYPVTLGCGAINADPFFGKTNAGIYFQIVPPNTKLIFTNYTVDSAVLVLPYGKLTAGDSSNTSWTQTYTVYRVTDPRLKLDSSLPAYVALSTDMANPLSSPVTVNVHSLKDSVNVDGVNVAPHLRIKLNNNFITPITAPSDSSKYSDFPTFLSWFNGLYIQASSTNQTQSLPYFRLDESGAGNDYSKANVIIYYHFNSNTDSTSSMSFPFTTSLCGFYNQIQRDYTGYPAQQYVLPYSAWNSNVNSDFAPMQNTPGASIDFKIYNIKSIPTSIINKAQIILTIPSTHPTSIFTAPPRIYVYTVADTGKNVFSTPEAALNLGSPSVPIDEEPYGNSYLSDYVDGVQGTDGVTYKLNIPRTLQAAIAQGVDTLHLRISGTTDFYGAYSLIAAGGNYSDPSLRLRMYVIYTKQK